MSTLHELAKECHKSNMVIQFYAKIKKDTYMFNLLHTQNYKTLEDLNRLNI